MHEVLQNAVFQPLYFRRIFKEQYCVSNLFRIEICPSAIAKSIPQSRPQDIACWLRILNSMEGIPV